ncbi:tetraacyldisaccharide 4'-kinase [Campylobacter sp. RM12327]|uniref:tetraacyldisaccharide 4'-kinase n=1 Tax=Campylobacter sputorum TaxID=206 RepID=UPI000B783580|nr:MULTISPECIES: tetraacyldisaccharide 4'-kinase [Campylobacter]MBE7358150.1 tetraacyldisaccharide 4'-kinase [Campylobacter sp. RM11302]MBF6669404.1 tetraacyldisaccharide 4'-kinase [Campylobacter sp. RM12327]MBF6674409.1 tetraacyldisaccharide 4'-kinase [Campylobacter sp. RM13538]MBF6676159.1 tetraacyldisaccharide 4'-kinase [Campylobacter sp. RM12321]MBF6677825.1 tetraacyldisaccharide 4'-kinase [Campylobacter sp. RM11259]
MCRQKIHLWINRYFYRPNLFDVFLSIALLPFSFVYGFLVCIKKLCFKPKNFDIKIISVGNIIVGGSGKTPLVKAIYELFSPQVKTFIVLRGYKRKSSGCLLVANDGEIFLDVIKSGDEAMEYAKFKANVIVSEDRKLGIDMAKKYGAKLIIFDDGFSKFDIKKFDILLKPQIEPFFSFTFPSGAYRYPTFFYKFANFIPQNSDIIKNSKIINPSNKMLLVTAIANPHRLKDYFDKCVGIEFYPDHYDFNKNELLNLLQKYQATTLLVTMKDFVKIERFNLPTSIIVLETTISQKFAKTLYNYVFDSKFSSF